MRRCQMIETVADCEIGGRLCDISNSTPRVNLSIRDTATLPTASLGCQPYAIMWTGLL